MCIQGSLVVMASDGVWRATSAAEVLDLAVLTYRGSRNGNLSKFVVSLAGKTSVKWEEKSFSRFDFKDDVAIIAFEV